jgi:hypothetical protein
MLTEQGAQASIQNELISVAHGKMNALLRVSAAVEPRVWFDHDSHVMTRIFAPFITIAMIENVAL